MNDKNRSFMGLMYVFLFLLSTLLFSCSKKVNNQIKYDKFIPDVKRIYCVESGGKKECKQEWRNAKGYYERGVASWYGKRFHWRKMANGERFNMYNSKIAAHPSLPFGTKVKVMNIKTNKIIDVIIKDRGPFFYGRSIDLSMAAAKKLGGGCYKKGTCKVAMWVE